MIGEGGASISWEPLYFCGLGRLEAVCLPTQQKGQEAQSAVKGRIWFPVSEHAKSSLLRDCACNSQLSLRILDYAVLVLPSLLPLASEARPLTGKQSELSIAMNLIIFKSLVSHGRLRDKQGWGGGGQFSRQWSEDKKTLAEVCTAKIGGVQMKINIEKRRTAHLTVTLLS